MGDIRENWERLGVLLSERRGRMGPHLASRQKFSAATGLNERLMSDLENARRTSYKPATLAAVERAYGWAPGSVQRVLEGGDPVEISAVVVASNLVDAGVDVSPAVIHMPSALRQVVDTLTAAARAERKSIAEILLDQGVDPGELVIPDAPPDDPEILELIALGRDMDLPPETVQRLIRINLENRVRRYEEAKERRRRQRGES